MICSKCCFCSVTGSKFYCAIKDGHIEGYPEICSQFQPVKNCGRCKNDPAFFNAMRELCNPCIFETDKPKPKKTKADKIRSFSDENLAQFLVDVAGAKNKAQRAILINYVKAWLQEEDDE